MSNILTAPNIACDIAPRLLEQYEEQSFTIIHCVYTTSPIYSSGWWINISPKTYLVSRYSGEKLQMTHAIGIPLTPAKKYLHKFGDKANFTLIFPKIPEDWSVFNLQEFTNTGGDGFAALYLRRNDSGVYRVKILN